MLQPVDTRFVLAFRIDLEVILHGVLALFSPSKVQRLSGWLGKLFKGSVYVFICFFPRCHLTLVVGDLQNEV